MKHMKNKFVYCLWWLFLLGSCANNMEPSLQNEEVVKGMGMINLSISETGKRTIIPAVPTFCKYEFIFEALDGQDGHATITVYNEGSVWRSVYLEEGHWTITVKGYVNISGIAGIDDGDYLVAEEKQGNLMIYADEYYYLVFDLKMNNNIQSGEKGILSWDIQLPDDAQSAAMIIQTMNGLNTGGVNPVNLLDTPQGMFALESGYYLLTLSLDDQRFRTEVLHIYDNMTSRITKSLYRTPAFNKLNDLADYLSKLPDNTVNMPYDIILYGLDLEVDFSLYVFDGYYSYDDHMVKLYDALSSGKFVNLDLSACDGLSIPSSVRSGARARKNMIVSVILPAKLTSIGELAFDGCINLELNELPAGLTSIDNSAFIGCSNLALTELPAGLTSIGNNAFYNCTNLALTKLPTGLTSIGNNAFYNCTNLALTELPAGLTSIGYYAFYNCTNLALTKLPTGLTSIDYAVFAGCTSLALTELPGGITSIGGGAFGGCTNLTLTELPTVLTSIGDGAFYGCTNLVLKKLPAGITSINYRAFMECTNLALTELPAGLTMIDNRAFSGCTNLTAMMLPAGITSIGAFAFAECTNLSLLICQAVIPPLLGTEVFFNTHENLIIKVPAESVDIYKSYAGWSMFANRIMAIGDYRIDVDVSFGQADKVITVIQTITGNLSKSGGAITLHITESFDRYEWFVGGTKVATGNTVTLQADNPAFAVGPNWITAVVYTSSNAMPWSGRFMIYVNY